ncbi:MAG: cob(I)yrinic acid a,c-diamide adenosyltransferase [Chloroflexi bacterium]|nr:cob(I)yrinic acid a,c-diamide adenosyltransferase [Chloroflexota bacterium]
MSGTVKSEHGLLIVHTGNGKGKTTAALGMLLRAWGWDMKAAMLQFVKHSGLDCGEHRAARRMNLEIISHGAGCTLHHEVSKKDAEMAAELWQMAKVKILSGDYQMMILDELSYPLRHGWVSLLEVIEVLARRGATHIVVTGRNMSAEIIDAADLVTEMKEIKHPLKSGVRAQRGIEF